MRDRQSLWELALCWRGLLFTQPCARWSAPCRTPVANSRGVPHILEHSVLCGSRKYPIKARGQAAWAAVTLLLLG